MYVNGRVDSISENLSHILEIQSAFLNQNKWSIKIICDEIHKINCALNYFLSPQHKEQLLSEIDSKKHRTPANHKRPI